MKKIAEFNHPKIVIEHHLCKHSLYSIDQKTFHNHGTN